MEIKSILIVITIVHVFHVTIVLSVCMCLGLHTFSAASHLASLTGVKEEYLSASEEGSILNKPDQLSQYCGVVYCVIPNTVFDQSSITSML